MLLGALLDLGWSLDRLQAVVNQLGLADVTIESQRVDKNSISATHVRVNAPHEQVHRGRDDLVAIIVRAGFPSAIEQKAIAVIDALAQAESKVHNVPVDQIHFHEVGAVDTIVDIAGAIVGLHELGITEICCSPLPWSHGTVKAAHGVLPVPPPAVVELLQGIPVVGVDVSGELVTPTGAALVRVLATSFGAMPSMQIKQSGYGAGTRDLVDRSNVLRIITGISHHAQDMLQTETLTVLACNIDDSNPEWLGALPTTLLQAGALDVWFTPIYMKKNRPATQVEVLCRNTDIDPLRALLFRHTTTLGVRESTFTRYALPRYHETITTRYGDVRIKFARLPDGNLKYAPEHDDCVARAQEHHVSVRDVWLAAVHAIES